MTSAGPDGAGGTTARAVAAEALRRIDEGAYANLVVPALLDRSTLDGRDRRFVTELVYGTTRMRRACDFLVGRFLTHAPPADVARVLALGAYQLYYTATPHHAAVGETVGLAPRRHRALANAVLRRLASTVPRLSEVDWPNEATRLSYPDWIVERLEDDLGPDAALAALSEMNRRATVTRRDDDYAQDPASQAVVEMVGATQGERVADVCAAPGGKATALAHAGATVAAGDLHPGRVGLIVENTRRTRATGVAAYRADGRRPPLRPESFDAVLLDAPCSGLGVLRRRPDARWRIQPSDVEGLARLQLGLLDGAASLVRPGGRLVYSVCTLTTAETTDVAQRFVAERTGFVDDTPVSPPFTRMAVGARILPQSAGTDGMFVAVLHKVRS